ncbi:hypothetical protein F5144DRAFT_556835 [Chaetomium tenue]|uniref:Uncharacterized protein n=1 Tax=Chaetomium tenue TaxID=1854479 RepID=A0ACB7PP44_9PEZI|nr:hypothetical protein F5144DRAFT_556835 [Chaetomium globosum]
MMLLDPLCSAVLPRLNSTLAPLPTAAPRHRTSGTHRLIPGLASPPIDTMGWFDGWFGSDNSGSDPLGRLDPKLREFLEKESPVKYSNNNNPSSQPQQQPQPPPSSDQKPTTTSPTGTPQPPPESLYPDGRYAHLWKTYRSLATVEAETKSDNEKLSDVLEAFKERKGLIGRAALENCAEEQVDWTECMKSGSWTARMTMCRDEVQKFERCYSAQSRLLKALGYLSVHGRNPQVDEDIQMRADELYHRMLAHEREVEKAKEEGREAPVLKTLFEDAPAPAARADAAGTGVDVPEPNAAVVASWKTALEKLPPEEREAEEKALRAEHRAKAEMAAKVQGLWQEQAKEREKRKAEGKETFMDRFSALAGSWSGPKSA